MVVESRQPLINFRLDPRTGLAPYRQLVDQVRQAVSLGLLRPGDRLPSVREVVTQVTINPNTVHRAYRELEHEGVVEGLSLIHISARSWPATAASSRNS